MKGWLGNRCHIHIYSNTTQHLDEHRFNRLNKKNTKKNTQHTTFTRRLLAHENETRIGPRDDLLVDADIVTVDMSTYPRMGPKREIAISLQNKKLLRGQITKKKTPITQYFLAHSSRLCEALWF